MANSKVNWGLAGLAGGTGAGWLWGRSKQKSSPSFDYKPYSGLRPLPIDTPEKSILRPTQAQVYDILSAGARGEGVGYDPKRRELLAQLVRSELGQQEEDQLRSAQGAISSSGLSGNPRAYEALAGRVKRDTGRNLENSMSRIAIEDLTRQNEERDLNRARLQDLNTFNFGQENKRADFDLSVYGAEEGNRLGAAGFNEGIKQYGQNRKDEQLSDLAELGMRGGDMYLKATNPTYAGAMSFANLVQPSGTGIKPSYDFSNPMATSAGFGYRKTFNRNLVR